MTGPKFDRDFQDQFELLLRWRRDVRRFRGDPVPEAALAKLFSLAALAPSVGNSQPWRFIRLRAPRLRREVKKIFLAENEAAARTYSDAKAAKYRALKLAGLDQAPEHFAVFSLRDPAAGAGLGRRTMPETLAYSTVGAIQILWLAARAMGLGLGWLSIVDPVKIKTLLDAPADWDFIAYLCLGYPEEEHEDPELERHGWQARQPLSVFMQER